MITILLARHGQASFGQNNYDKLSELGVKQAQMLGAHYAHSKRRIDAIYSGNLVRQQDSARYFLSSYQSALGTDRNADIINMASLEGRDNLDSHVLSLFNEFNHQDVFIKSNAAFVDKQSITAEIDKSDEPMTRLAELFDQAMQRWHSGEHDADYEESWSLFSMRAQQALNELCEQIVQAKELDNDSTVIVFTSGGVIAAISAFLYQQSSQLAYQLNRSLINTGVTSITVHQQGLRLLSLNEHSHLFASGERFVTWR